MKVNFTSKKLTCKNCTIELKKSLGWQSSVSTSLKGEEFVGIWLTLNLQNTKSISKIFLYPKAPFLKHPTVWFPSYSIKFTKDITFEHVDVTEKSSDQLWSQRHRSSSDIRKALVPVTSNNNVYTRVHRSRHCTVGPPRRGRPRKCIVARREDRPAPVAEFNVSYTNHRNHDL